MEINRSFLGQDGWPSSSLMPKPRSAWRQPATGPRDGAPKGTPVEIINRLNTEINAGLADPKMKVRIAQMGETTLAASPAAFGKLIAGETSQTRVGLTLTADMRRTATTLCDRMLTWSRSPLESLLGHHLDEKDHFARLRDQRA
jgi:hypothetical protein